DVAADAESVARALREPSDLVLVDLHMPDIDIEAIVQAAGETPVVAFGRHTDAPALRAARQAGCAEVLPRSDFVTRLPALLSTEAPA
ncbi:MAG TPA: hypothetical protein VNL92_00580, partial [Dehalococcoidia bacterium]|nr:hypothetical protein [Dehalococcoidia bacterium]